MMGRGALGALLLLACGEPLAEPAAAPPPAPPRGALLIVVDTLRADHVGVYGSKAGLTPHMDALAADGLVFANAVASSSWTRPAIASMFTGQYPTSLGVLTKADALGDEVETLAETLGSAGVRSVAISTNGNAGRNYGFDQGFQKFWSGLPKRGYPDDKTVTPAEEVSKKALQVVDSLPPDEPFFLFLHYIDPHAPYLPHPGLLEGPEPPGRFDGSRKALMELDRLPEGERTRVDEQRIEYLYAAEVKYCDLWLGKLFDGLAERGLLDELLVIVTSDHGEGLWDHGVRYHGVDLYEESIRVPFVVRFPPGHVPVTGSVDGFASHVDVAPTILGAFGISSPVSSQGRDLGLALRTGNFSESRLAYSEMTHLGIDLESLSDGDVKLIRDRQSDGFEWFELLQDPRELSDRSSSEGATRSRLHRILREWALRNTAQSIESTHVNVDQLDAATRADLEALGYL